MTIKKIVKETIKEVLEIGVEILIIVASSSFWYTIVPEWSGSFEGVLFTGLVTCLNVLMGMLIIIDIFQLYLLYNWPNVTKILKSGK